MQGILEKGASRNGTQEAIKNGKEEVKSVLNYV